MQIPAIRNLPEMARIARFGTVGLSGALLYAIIVLTMVRGFGVDQVVASGISYLIGIPYSYFGQKYFTFKSSGAVIKEFPQFILLQGFNLLLSMAVTYCVVDLLRQNDLAGVVAVTLAVAASSYCVMKLGIFRMAQAAKTEWQDISKIPMDGTLVEVYAPPHGVMKVYYEPLHSTPFGIWRREKCFGDLYFPIHPEKWRPAKAPQQS